MSNFLQAFMVELLKARRSKMVLFTALGFAMLPLGGGFFLVILKDPEFARKVGLIGAKAQLTMGAADWPTYLNFLALGTAMAGFMLFTLIGAWVFGREFSDHTVKDLLALPTPRSSIVMAKFGVGALWSAILVAMIYPLALVVGSLVGLPPVPAPVMIQGGITLAAVAILTLIVVTPIIYFASYGHGYLAPVGVMIVALVLAQVMGIIGYGEYFPWSIAAGVAQGEALSAVSLFIVVVTCIAGIAGTLFWWKYADQTH
jgi:ABC-2 type transport system permease protein